MINEINPLYQLRILFWEGSNGVDKEQALLNLTPLPLAGKAVKPAVGAVESAARRFTSAVRNFFDDIGLGALNAQRGAVRIHQGSSALREASGVAAKALENVRWGVSRSLMRRILSRNGPHSTNPTTSKFVEGFDIEGAIIETLESSKTLIYPDKFDKSDVYNFVLRYGKKIGTDIDGEELTAIQVTVDRFGEVFSVYPVVSNRYNLGRQAVREILDEL